MLVTLIVLWVIVIPAVTVAAAYVRSGLLARRSRSRAERLPLRTTVPVRVATGRDG